MPLKVAVVGGECTGKTRLCEALAAQLPGLWVPEYLREFVEQRERAPRADDQATILATQIERESAAVAAAERNNLHWVLCDSAPIVTAIYSEMYFADKSLYAPAERHHATYAFTLLTDTDLPWSADGLQRESPAMRTRSHRRIRAWLREHRVPFTLVNGNGAARDAAALSALRAVESSAR